MEPIKNYLMSRAMAPLMRSLKTSSPPEGSSSLSSFGVNWVLDPTSVMIALAINGFKPVGTKLSISEGKVLLHDVSMLQGTIRTFYGESKVNIKVLHFPIINACRYYAKHESDNPDMQFLFQKARRGLENLWHTYHEDRETRTCLNTYMNIMQTAVTNGPKSLEMLDMLVSLDIADVDKEKDAAEVRKGVSDKLHKAWDANKITIAVGLIRELDTATPASRQHLFDSIDAFMAMMHGRCRVMTEA